MTSREIDYQSRVEDALRNVVRDVLTSVADQGLPGEHHFFITFRTDAPGIEISSALRHKYPEEMTVILQHQFWDLLVEQDAFEVTLRFEGEPQRLRVPFAALKSFVDPAAEFGLRFESREPAPDETEEGLEKEVKRPGEVVSLDEFRKKSD